MRKTLFTIFVFVAIISFAQDNENPSNKRYFSDTEKIIKKYREDCQKYYDVNDVENARKYYDSINYVTNGSYIKDYTFETYDNKTYKTSKLKKPLFLMTSASWCKPCRVEVPALNKVVEEYYEQVDFVVLFWDKLESLKRLAPDYNEKIYLVPSKNSGSNMTTLDINGFRHITGYPKTYLISTENRIVENFGGAAVPQTYTDENGKEKIITSKDAFDMNYKTLKNEVKKLLKETNTNKR